MLDYKSILSDIQYRAVSDYSGASLVIAGAGSGKTRVLTYRIAYMIEQGVAPYNILSLTFTKKAAGEMRSRIQSVVSEQRAKSIYMGTFHSIFRRILSAEAEALGFTTSFSIYQTSEARSLLKTIIREMGLDDKKYDPKKVLTKISLAKNNLTTPQIYSNNSSLVGDDIKSGMGEFHNVYRNYMVRCKQNNAMDFDDLLLYTNILFRNFPEILSKYQDKFKYVLVDEYQDTNYSQYLIVKKLCEKHSNICVVGDDAQSIYSFRGAKIENILRFQKDYPNAKITKLEENYRSTQTIVNAANSVISKNQNQLKKTVFSNRDVGECIALRRAYTEKEESMIVRSEIAQLVANGKNYKDIAVLYRNNSQARAIEDQLRKAQMPYLIYKGQSFYESAEVMNVLAYIKLVVNRSDDEALMRIVNFPTRGIGSTSLEKIKQFAVDNKQTIYNTISLFNLESIGLKAGAMRSIKSFVDLIDGFSEKAKTLNAYDFVYSLVKDSGIVAHYSDSHDPEKMSAYENVEELVNSVKQQCVEHQKENESELMIEEWIQDVILLTTDEASDGGDSENRINLMTIHAAKGLEFDTVFMIGVEEGIFPSQRSVESITEIEEERRLFYVAVTRAVNKLFVSYSLSRFQWGETKNTIPSRFVKEIDNCYYDCPDLVSAENAYCGADDEDEPKIFKRNYAENKTQFIKERYSRSVSSPTQTQSSPRFDKLKKVSVTTGERVQTQGNLSEGDRVRHDKFGDGTIKSLEKTPTDIRVCVAFDQNGEKNLLQKFAKLKKI